MAKEPTMPKKQDAVELGLPHADELTALLRRAREGDRTALPALRKVLDAKPSVWRAVGDLGNLAEQAMLDLIAGEDLLVRESVKRTLAQMRQDLCGQKASPLEVLIARRAAVAWLHVSYLDVLLARAEKLDAVEARRLQNRRDRSNLGYLLALKNLAVVRKLLGDVSRQATTPE
jgi:hypothetical protein